MLPIYCERLGSGPLAEPLNIISNSAFFFAAWAAWRTGRRSEALMPELGRLVLLTVAIGIGSTLWHMLATPWIFALDVIPILLFQQYFLWVYCRRIIGLEPCAALFLILMAGIVAYLGKDHQDWLNGISLYFVTLGILLGTGIDFFWRSERGRYLLLSALTIFCVSLFFRTIDHVVCPYWPEGTHFLWHLFNGFLLFLVMRALAMGYPNVEPAISGEPAIIPMV